MESSPVYVISWGDWKVEDVTPCTSPQQLYPSPSPVVDDLILTEDYSFNQTIYNYDDSINLIGKDPLKKEEADFGDLETTESKAQVASKLLDDLDHLEQLDQWIKEEPLPFSDWLEEKIDLPIFGDISSPPLLNSPAQVQPVILIAPHIPAPQTDIHILQKPCDTTQSLLQEFENVFEQVTLTPPQSPQNGIFAPMQPVPINVAKELAVVDELVRCRAEGLVDSSWDDSSNSSTVHPLSPSSTSESDPEWIPETITNTTSVIAKKKSRSKPYERPLEDKKSRKKEQNKNAATRYRQKKKAEIVVILSEQKGLEDIHEKFQNEVNDLSREIKYLKGLMRDLFKAKGLIQ